jgi:hypothetical protein
MAPEFRDFDHSTEGFKLCLKVFLVEEPCSLRRSLLLFLEVLFFPKTVLFTDLLQSGNSLTVGVYKQQDKAT